MNPQSSAIEIIRGLARREFSARELVDDALRRIESTGAALNAFITLCPDAARAAADAADAARAAGTAGPLAGLPMAHKDIFCTRGLRTTCASHMLSDWVPPYDATVVERTRETGAICIGKTNMDEFAMGSSNENSHFGPVRNPWDPTRVPGGSSGGSAAAVAAGLVPVATATDTGGSIRQPASFCGVTGIKPTYGRISRWGMVAFASSLDQAGVIARSAADAALLLAPLCGFDPRDSTSADVDAAPLLEPLTARADCRVGVVRGFVDLLDAPAAAAFEEAARTLERLGATLVEVDLPHADHAVAAYYVIAPAEASANLSRYDGVRFGHRCADPANLEDLYTRSRSEGFGTEVQRRILVGTFALSVGWYDAYYRQAQRVRRLIRDDFLRAFEHVDVLLAPTAPGPAFPLGEMQDDPVRMYQQDAFTIPVSLAGLPALSMPAGMVSGLPVGVQLVGPHFAERRILELAHAWQQETDWHLLAPGEDAR